VNTIEKPSFWVKKSHDAFDIGGEEFRRDP
jgi:hypothetical protein